MHCVQCDNLDVQRVCTKMILCIERWHRGWGEAHHQSDLVDRFTEGPNAVSIENDSTLPRTTIYWPRLWTQWTRHQQLYSTCRTAWNFPLLKVCGIRSITSVPSQTYARIYRRPSMEHQLLLILLSPHIIDIIQKRQRQFALSRKGGQFLNGYRCSIQILTKVASVNCCIFLNLLSNVRGNIHLL